MSHVLVLRALGLGDFLTSVPALRALRAAFPAADLTVAMPAELAPLLRLAGLDAAVYDAHALADPLRLPRPDLAVNLHGRGPQSHWLLLALTRSIVAFANDAAGVDGPAWRQDEHERRRWCRLVEDALGVPADPDDLRLRLPSAEPAVDGAFVVHPGAGQAARAWPPERYAQVVRWAADRGHEVVITGSARERPLADRVAHLSGVRVLVVAGETHLDGLAALVGRARTVVCGDTGVGHLASAYGVPSVQLFGPTSPHVWGPPDGPHTVLWHPNEGGDPLAGEPDPALLEITTDEVLAQLAQACPVGGRGTVPP